MKWYKVFGSHVPQRKCEPFSASVAGALLPSAISAVGGLASNAMSLFGAKSNRDWQEEENEKNRQWQEKMWHLQNEFNSPLHQRELLQEAGFNPYMYGKDSPFVGAGSSGAPAMAGTPALPNLSNPLGGSAQLLQQGLQIESNVELQHMKSLQTVSDIMLNLYKEGGQKQVDDFMREFAPALKSINFEGSFFEQKLKKEFLSMDIANDRADLERSLRQKFGYKEMQAKLNFIDKEISKMSAEISKMSSEKALNYKRVEELGSEMARNFAQAGLFSAQSSQITVLLPYIRSIMENDAMNSEFIYQENASNYFYGSRTRKWKKTSAAQIENQVDFTSEHNPIFDFLRGFTKSVPVSPVGIYGSQNTKFYGREGSESYSRYNYLPFGQ